MNKLALVRQFTDGLPDTSVRIGEIRQSGSLPPDGKYAISLQSLKMTAGEFLGRAGECPDGLEGFRKRITCEDSLYFATDSGECLIDLLSALLLAEDDEFGYALDAGENLMLIEAFERVQAVEGMPEIPEAKEGYYYVKAECIADRQSIYDIFIDSDWIEEHYIGPVSEGPLKSFSDLVAELDLDDDDDSDDSDESDGIMPGPKNKTHKA